MPARFEPSRPPERWRSGASNSEKLYGAIVAQARLPVFYRSLGVPDTLEGRFALLSLHLFAVLHRLKAEGAEGARLAQELVDRFSQDMETVLRELGVERSPHPKEDAGPCRLEHGPARRPTRAPLPRARARSPHAIAAALPDGTEQSGSLAAGALASYLSASR